MKSITSILIATAFFLPCAADAYTNQERLGFRVFHDENLSKNNNQSCASCHIKGAGFADPDNKLGRFLSPVSKGSDPTLFGGRNAPTAAYAGFSPVFAWNTVDALYIGGLFWDGRATGKTLGDPLAEQAQAPFFNPVEMALTQVQGEPRGKAVVDRVMNSSYSNVFKKACGTPATFAEFEAAFDCIGKAIAAFERTDAVSPFNSLFDAFRIEQGGDVSTFGIDAAGNYVGVPEHFQSWFLNETQAKGLALFNAVDKGKCALCHPTANFDEKTPPMFTDFSYDNLGFPFNPRIAAIGGPQPIDYGLGAKTTILTNSEPPVLLPKYRGNNKVKVPVVASEAGKHKVSTLRNIARNPPYGHNGIFGTLYEVVHFYNTRDTGGMWGPPEVPATVNTEELGNLGLAYDEEIAVVEFLKTLSDR
ncbi:MAG: cytochrome-c peroxidase [Syntrophobacteraceae bacterium]